MLPGLPGILTRQPSVSLSAYQCMCQDSDEKGHLLSDAIF